MVKGHHKACDVCGFVFVCDGEKEGERGRERGKDGGRMRGWVRAKYVSKDMY